MRTCVVTREKLPKQELIRVVRTPEQTVIIDLSGKANGRGAYVKRDINVIDKARKSKILERTLEITINDEVYNELEKMC